MSLALIRRLVTAQWHVRATMALWRGRAASAERIGAAAPRRVLVVCHGNIYRSAFVAAFLQIRVGAAIVVRSVGFHSESGRASPERHVRMCHEVGVDLRNHRSSVITPADLAWADVVVLMDRKNWVQLRRMGAPTGKLVWLGAWAPPGGIEISDPYGMDDAAARLLLNRLLVSSKALGDALLRVGEDRGRLPTGRSTSA